tara:strand:+ start:272 stop:553 length:282 start_codon:yes stop_codon:yes gene_type:complete
MPKEKKLNAIKSEILEIKEFVTSNKKDKDTDVCSDNESHIDPSDIFTLTNIVNNKQKAITSDDLADIKDQLYTVESILTKQELILKEILLKLK